MPNLSTKDGTPTGGVFGFATLALEVIKKLKPDYVAVAWDKPKTNIRSRLKIYSEYKAGRKPAPADFYEQVPVLHELLSAFGWPLYEMDDYEADDIMGALATQAAEQNIDTLLVTSDLDLLQIVGEHVSVYALKKGLSNIELYSPKSFEAKYHIKVDQFLDMKSLKGDSSDNIPGVPGIGEKGAVQLLTDYQTLDGIYENLALIKDSMRKKLEAGRESAYMSKELARIFVDAPIKLNLAEVDGSKCDPEKLLGMLEDLEFRSLARQLPDIMQIKIADHKSQSGAIDIKAGKNVLITNDAELSEVNLSSAEQLYVYSRASGRHGNDPELLAISADAKTTFVLDMKQLDGKKVLDLIGQKSLVGYNVKSTLELFLGLGASDLNLVSHDVLIANFLLNPLDREQSLGAIVQSQLGAEINLNDMSPSEARDKSAEVISVIKALHDQQLKELKGLKKLAELASDIEWPIIPVLARMERAGIELDTNYLAGFSEEIDDLISDYQQQIYGFADIEFNIDSPTQLAKVLFEDLKLPTTGIKKGKTGYSTAASELEKLRAEHPIVEQIVSYREVAKLKNTYVDTLPKLVDKNSRIHTTFNLTVAQTGRLSSTDPNLQNIPTRTDLGRRIRTAFVAGEGKKLVSADYSQFELRLAAYLSDDKKVIDMFNRGADVHTQTAALVYGREPEDVTKQMRRDAKTVNFGIMYGQGPHALALGTGMTFEQARNFIKKYFEIRPKLKEYIEKTREQADKQGYVETLFGRRRPTPDVKSSNFNVREGAYRAAVNMPIQGTEADLMKMAMIEIDKKLRDMHNDCRMLLQIHDSVLVECPSEVADDVAKMLRDTMENIYELPVKLDVDAAIGDNWGEL